MEQERIDWTLEIISQLKEEGIGDKRKLDEIQNQLENNFEISDKDSKYLKKHYEILEKREQKQKSKVCARCSKTLGFMKYSPKEYSGYKEKLCVDCVTIITRNHKSFEGKYEEGTLGLKSGTGIELHLNNFDGGSIVILSKKDFFKFAIENMKSYQQIELEKESMAKKIITAGMKETSKSENLEILFNDKTVSDHRILLKIKDLEKAMIQIFELKKFSDVKPVQITHESEATLNQQEEKPEQLNNKVESELGRIIKQTPTAQYYGGHKAYLAGGTFGDAQNGILILTEKYLIFTKNAMRESKKWRIVIPLDKVILGDWKIDEKVRRKSMAGGGVGFGFFGGAGTIHDTGKSHDIIVPYVDENGIEQAPRFGVSSLTGNAIREWAKLIYDVLVNIQKQKKPEPEKIESVETENKVEDPLKVLKLRLAKGEITKEEFEELKELID
ncbi:MAG: hypothetical protein CO032_00035 [Nitrosopumilales archaeon CG_4_9_14_0_2_um_filter_34_16]|nr:MAG: hypothetical protein CO032_00035 [Nitrosopumilales archaeon CG_4_9_14_0_2_um_filter_34_16]